MTPMAGVRSLHRSDVLDSSHGPLQSGNVFENTESHFLNAGSAFIIRIKT